MSGKIKRTYNLGAATIRRVRELAKLQDVAASQDAVVELAVERLYQEVRARQEAAAWDEAAADPTFTSEATRIQADYGDTEAWPG